MSSYLIACEISQKLAYKKRSPTEPYKYIGYQEIS